jgi:hypothetical protein
LIKREGRVRDREEKKWYYCNLTSAVTYCNLFPLVKVVTKVYPGSRGRIIDLKNMPKFWKHVGLKLISKLFLENKICHTLLGPLESTECCNSEFMVTKMSPIIIPIKQSVSKCKLILLIHFFSLLTITSPSLCSVFLFVTPLP